MSDITGIIGTDGYAPIVSDARWSIWSIHQIYLGNEGQNRFIPKVGDWVVDNLSNPVTVYRVTDLNNITMIPELTPINFVLTPNEDSILSSTLDNYRIYYDKSVFPYTLTVDGLLRIYSSEANYAIIYKGNLIDNTKIISRKYDNSGNLIGTEIPLELVSFNSHDNYGIKYIPGCNTNAELQTGDICTIAVFSSSNKLITKVTAIVDETTYVAPVFVEQKYITQIELISPFINVNNDNEILYPVNLPLTSFNPLGKVYYNDGSSITYPIDNDKFRLYGLESFISTIIGHKVPLVLSYRLDSNEAALATVTTDGAFITRPYNLIVSKPNTSYNVKLFIYPVWIDGVNGYTYKAFLLNLDRNVIFEVTNYLTLSTNSPSFNPLGYGITQRLTFNINLENVSGIYNFFIHTQTVDIILRGPATDNSLTNIWEVATQVPSNRPYFGTNLRATRNQTQHNKVSIHNNIPTVQEFIEKLYLNTMPLYNVLTESGPLEPTHISVKYLNDTVTVPISQYNSQFTFSSNVSLYSNIDIIFYKETVSGYLTLSVASLTVR